MKSNNELDGRVTKAIAMRLQVAHDTFAGKTRAHKQLARRKLSTRKPAITNTTYPRQYGRLLACQLQRVLFLNTRQIGFAFLCATVSCEATQTHKTNQYACTDLSQSHACASP